MNFVFKLAATCSIFFIILSGCKAEPGFSWPPQVGKKFPNVDFIDAEGNKVRLAQFKGKILLVEMIGMSCSACNAFSGALERGGFSGIIPQPGLPSIHKLIADYSGGVSLDDSRIHFVQILLYNLQMKAPSPRDLKLWAEHFGFDKQKNVTILGGTPELIGPASYNLIPGFQLVDKNLILRSDSSGHHPRDNLYTKLLPMLGKLVE